MKTPFLMKGFTVVEILILVLIIAILIAIIFPAFDKVQEKSRTVICASHLSNFGRAIIGFSAENNGNLPPYKNVITDPQGFQGYTTMMWNDPEMWAYQYREVSPVEFKKILRCPSDHTAGKSPRSLPTVPRNYSSYATTYEYLMYWGDGVPPPSNVPGWAESRYVSLAESQRKILLLDGMDMSEGDGKSGDINGVAGPLMDWNADKAVSSRHGGGANCLFGDGSIQWISKTELINDPPNGPKSLYTR